MNLKKKITPSSVGGGRRFPTSTIARGGLQDIWLGIWDQGVFCDLVEVEFASDMVEG